MGFPRSTLSDKVNGNTTSQHKGPEPYLGREVEERIASWLKKMARDDDFTRDYSVTLENLIPAVFAIRSNEGAIRGWLQRQNVDFFVKLMEFIPLEDITMRPITSTFRVKKKGIFENRQKVSVLLQVNAERNLTAILELVEKEGFYCYLDNVAWPLM